MKLTTRGHYSVKALLDLAIHRNGPPRSIRAIAEHQQIPQHFLEQLLIILRRHGFVRSVRGAQGGYVLARPPAQISLGAVLRAVGDGIAPLEHKQPGEGAEDWVTFALWQRLHHSLTAALEQISLEDLYFDARSHQAVRSEAGSFVV